MEEHLIRLYESQYVRIDSAGLTPEQLLEIIMYRIKPEANVPHRPQAIVIEGGGDFKGLLSEGLEVEEGDVPRKWSQWKQIDPVALDTGKVV